LYASLIFLVCIARPFNTAQFDRPNNIKFRAQIMTLLLKCSSAFYPLFVVS